MLVSEIAITSNSFFIMLRNSSNLSNCLSKLLILTWKTENEFLRNFSTLHGIFSKDKYGYSTTSNKLLKKFMSESPLSLFKICSKSRWLKTFFWELAKYSSGRFPRKHSGFIHRRLSKLKKLKLKVTIIWNSLL